MEKQYAQALDSLIASGMKEEEAFIKLVAHLKEKGRLKILPQLLRELETQAKRKQSREPMLEVANEKVKTTSEAGKAKRVVNESLLSGWRLTTADTLIDRSGKRALIDMYRKITH